MYTDIDRMILERWDEVNQLIEAREETKDRIAKVIEAATERLRRWLEPQGYELQSWPKDGEFHVWRRTWDVKKKGPAVKFILEGFCPPGYRRGAETFPCLWLATTALENYKLKEADRRAFAAGLRAELGASAADWDDDACDDANGPLVQYLREFDRGRQVNLVSSADNLAQFTMEHLSKSLAISDVVDRCVSRAIAR